MSLVEHLPGLDQDSNGELSQEGIITELKKGQSQLVCEGLPYLTSELRKQV